MSDFTLDTSGEVRGARLIEQPDGNWRSHWSWSDLSPFAQGYVEAMFASGVAIHGHGALMRVLQPKAKPVGFSDVAPETLAAILKDCEAYREQTGLFEGNHDLGRNFWTYRQRGWRHHPSFSDNFPPLTVYLGDDGKVRTR